MANNRKLQADIDRLLKKTNEGLEEYEELYEKFDNASNPSAKERLEGDLKKEIKKLQRQREQIKAYIASSEVKDTKALEQYRKKIEEKMEAFKVCEREMKTKAFSKEGLASAANEWNESPLAQTEAWLKNSIEECRKKIEILEYEVQKSSQGTRARSKTKTKSDSQQRLEKMQIHFYKWEALLRMVNNEELEPEDVDDLRPDIEKVLSESSELATISSMDMYDAFDIPDPKIKPVVEEDAAAADDKKTSQSAKSAAKKTPVSTVAQGGKAAVPPSTAPTAASSAPMNDFGSGANVASGGPASPVPPAQQATADAAAAAATPTSALGTKAATATSLAETAGSGVTPLLPRGSPAVASGAFTDAGRAGAEDEEGGERRPGRSSPIEPGAGGADELEGEEAPPEWMDDAAADELNDDTFGDDAMGGISGGTLTEMAAATGRLMADPEWERRLREMKRPAEDAKKDRDAATAAEGTKSKGGVMGSTAESVITSTTRPAPTNDWESRKLELKKSKPEAAGTTASASSSAPAQPVSVTPPAASSPTPSQAGANQSPSPAAAALNQPSQQPQPSSSASGAPITAVNTTTNAASSNASAPPRQATPVTTEAAAATASSSAATAATAPAAGAHRERHGPCAYDAAATLGLLDMSLANLPHTLDVERQRPYEPPNAIEPIPYFPQEVHPILSCREIYHQFDIETLFFIFYYHQKSYQQYFAAKELKAHSFRYHMELRRWYQRREKPRETTQNSERGAYTYFDYEDTWQKQTVDDFTFEYKFLEDELN